MYGREGDWGGEEGGRGREGGEVRVNYMGFKNWKFKYTENVNILLFANLGGG